jgi:hypothetical protein
MCYVTMSSYCLFCSAPSCNALLVACCHTYTYSTVGNVDFDIEVCVETFLFPILKGTLINPYIEHQCEISVTSFHRIVIMLSSLCEVPLETVGRVITL